MATSRTLLVVGLSATLMLWVVIDMRSADPLKTNTKESSQAAHLLTESSLGVLDAWFDAGVVQNGTCIGPAYPTIRDVVPFFKEHHTWAPFQQHYEAMKAEFVVLHDGPRRQNATEGEMNSTATRLMALVSSMLELPRDNPGKPHLDPRWGRQVIPLWTQLAFIHSFELYGPGAVRWPIPAHVSDLHRLAFDRTFQLVYEQLQRKPASDVFRSRTDFKPQLFIDLGARDYDTSTVVRHHEGLPTVKSIQGSIPWFAAHYPGFDLLPTLAFEIDEQFAPPFAQEIARRKNVPGAAPFRLHTAAVWTHREGLAFRPSTMINPNDVCAQRDGCRCVPSVDLTPLLRQMPRHSVTLKIDIELFEWILLAEWAKAGVLDRFGEMFLECHTTSRLHPDSRIFRDPDFDGHDYFGTSFWAALMAPIDCVFIHEFVRSYHVATHPWP